MKPEINKLYIGGKEHILLYNSQSDVVSLDDVNRNIQNYKGDEYELLHYQNGFTDRTNPSLNRELTNVVIKVLDVDNNIVKCEIFGKWIPRFSKIKDISDINLLSDKVIKYCHIKDFTKGTKEYIQQKDLKSNDIILTLIKSAKKVIKLINDDAGYGYLYYSKKLSSVWWVGSDGLDFDDEDIIKENFSKISGIKNVIVELESFPDWKNYDEDELEDEENYSDDWIEIKFK